MKLAIASAAQVKPLQASLILLRHGQIDDAGLCVGQLDLPLNASGLALAQAICEPLSALTIGAIYSSDLQRAQQTAQPIARQLGLAIQTMTALRELHMGNFTGRYWQDLHQQQSAAMAHWGEHWQQQGPPGGESFATLKSRTIMALGTIAKAHTGASQSTLVLCHAGVMRAAAAHYGGILDSAAMQLNIPHGHGLSIPLTLVLADH